MGPIAISRPCRPTAVSENNTRPTMSAREVEQLFTILAFEAGMSLFSAYDVSLEPTDLEAYRQNPGLNLVSVIGFAGKEISGSLVLGATREPLARSKPVAATERDWIAELA